MSHRRPPGHSHHQWIQALKPSNTCANRAGVTQAVCLPQHPHAGLTSFRGEQMQCWPRMTVHLHGGKLTWIDLRSLSSIRGRPRFCHGLFVLRYSELPGVRHREGAVFWVTQGRCEIPVTQLVLLSHSLPLCLFQELVCACRMWPIHLPWCEKWSEKARNCAWHTGKDLLEGADSFSLKNPTLCNISSQLL